MADVKSGFAPSSTTIDSHLDRLWRDWRGLPDVAERWHTIDAEDQLVFLFEWAIVEDWLDRLNAWADDGLLSESQRARYGELIALAERNRPIIDRLWDDVPSADIPTASG